MRHDTALAQPWASLRVERGRGNAQGEGSRKAPLAGYRTGGRICGSPRMAGRSACVGPTFRRLRLRRAGSPGGTVRAGRPGRAGAAESRCARRAQSRERLHGHGDGAGALRLGCRCAARARRDARFRRCSGNRDRAAGASPGRLRSVAGAPRRAAAARRPALTRQQPGRPPRQVRRVRPQPSGHARGW